jgi:hypothetical protein
MENFHAAVIKRIGGRTYLAGVLRLPAETVKSWTKRGIPARYWHHIVRLAQDPNLTIADLERTKLPITEREAA